MAEGCGTALRTLVYHELLSGYLAYAKLRGFTSMFIWACPPLQGDDYILYCHPGKQKTPRSDRLREWYLSMLRSAKAEGTVAYISNLYDTFFAGGRDHRVERPSITDLPYLEGDYWPGEAENMLADMQAGVDDSASAGGGALAKGRKGGKDGKRSRVLAGASPDEQLLARVGEAIQGMREDFIVAHLYESCSHCRAYVDNARIWVHPSPPGKVVIKSERTFDGIALDKPGGESSRTVQLNRFQLCEGCYSREAGALEGRYLPGGPAAADKVSESSSTFCGPCGLLKTALREAFTLCLGVVLRRVRGSVVCVKQLPTRPGLGWQCSLALLLHPCRPVPPPTRTLVLLNPPMCSPWACLLASL